MQYILFPTLLSIQRLVNNTENVEIPKKLIG